MTSIISFKAIVAFDNKNQFNSNLVIKNSITTATIDTGITVIANTWYELVFRVNAAGNLLEFFVNGAKVGEVTTTANIPNGTGQAMGLQAGLAGATGTTDVGLDFDNLFFTTI
jgi:hypothetical protein